MQKADFLNDGQCVVGGGLHTSDFDDVISIENLLNAWKRFRKGKRSKSDVREFEFHLEENIIDLHQELAAGTWQPGPYQVFYVQDPKLRKIHKANVRDRVLYQAVYQKLYNIFDLSFIHDSYASRNRKGTHAGIERLRSFSRALSRNYTQTAFVLKCDIRKFFESIDHTMLIVLLRRKISDGRFLKLLTLIIDSFNVSKGKGLPLGNVTSQIFANIYLHELDQFCKRVLKIQYYIRYCDDFVILHESYIFLEDVIKRLQLFLKNKLDVELHPTKVYIRKLHAGVDFLGYVSMPYYVMLRTKTRRRMMCHIKQRKLFLEKGSLTKEFFDQSMQSYLGMLSHCKSDKIRQLIERMFYD